LEDIEARIANLLEQARTACPETIFILDFQKDIDRNQSLTSVEGVTIYRIIQEAINNAIKYAKADHIEVSLSKNQNWLSASVKDDGKGFNIKNPEIGNGLLNMKKRAKDITALYKIFSEENKGTSVSVSLNLDR
jgi:signal transduction histidine kinase